MANWKSTMKKFIMWKPDTRVVAVFCLLALGVVLIPLVRIAFYAVPWYDDYNYASFTKSFLAESPTLKGTLEGALYCVKTQWYAWQGTFSSIFFMALMPALWGEDKYVIGPLVLIALLTFAVFVLVKVLVRDVLHGDRASCLVLQSVTAIMVLMLIHTSQAGFYWYNAGIHYVGMHAFCILFVATAIRLLQEKKLIIKILLVFGSMLGALLAGGSNYVTSLQGVLLLATIMAVGALACGKRVCLLLPALGVYGIAFYLNVTAPGNQVRSACYVGWGYSPIQAVLHSFLEAVKHIGEFTGLITVAILLLMVPVIWQMVERINFQFRLPGLVLLWSFCLYATGFTPSLYSLGNAGLSRTLNAVKITYQVLLVINEVYLLGWFQGFLAEKGKDFFKGKCFWWFYPVMGVVMLLLFWMEPNQAGTYSSYGAYYYVHTGEAYNFHQEYLERVELLRGKSRVVNVEPYHFRPWMICVGDLAEDSQNEANQAIAAWYGKEAVTCSKE